MGKEGKQMKEMDYPVGHSCMHSVSFFTMRMSLSRKYGTVVLRNSLLEGMRGGNTSYFLSLVKVCAMG